MDMRTAITGLVLLTTLSALAGCAGNSDGDRAMAAVGLGSSVYDDDVVHLIPVSGPIAVDVELYSGEVTIDAGIHHQGDARVTIQREASHGYGRKDDADDSLAHMSESVELKPDALGRSVLTIRAGTTDAEAHYHRANVVIEATAIDGVRVRTHGRVKVTGARGAVEVATAGGDVYFATYLAMTEPVDITTGDGNIDFRIRAESTGRFDCESAGDKVLHRVRYGRFIIQQGTDQDSLRATLNDGENPVRLHATNGKVRIAVVPDPRAHGARIVDP
jgi:hypothetical protein